MLPEATRRRLAALAASSDPTDRAVAQRLGGQLHAETVAARSGETTCPPSRWRHVDLADLLAFVGNTVLIQGSRIKSGHEPTHGSRSGACVVAWPASGRWWCSSCHQLGDAVTLVMQARGVSYAEAARWLTERYGPPTNTPVSRAALRRRTFTGVIG